MSHLMHLQVYLTRPSPAEYHPLPLEVLQSKIKTYPTLHDADYHADTTDDFVHYRK